MSARAKALLAVCCLSLVACSAAPANSESILAGLGLGQQQPAAADRALAALARGDYAAAEALAAEALRVNVNDPYAILTLAVVYQNTGRPDLARRHYQALLALAPQAVATIGAGTQRSLVDIARDNLSRLPPAAEAASPPAAAPAAAVAGGDQPAGLAGAPASRFTVLDRLRVRGLVTEEEFAVRRRANLGALLPYSAPPPAAGLDRPPPGEEAVAQRLVALGQALAIGAMTARQHAEERTAILDALLPAEPGERAAPPPPPEDASALAAIVQRMERLERAGLISAEEKAREREAAAAALRRHMAARAPAATAESPAGAGPRRLEPAAAGAPGAAAAPPAIASRPPAGRFAVHLASFRSEAQADAAWRRLEARHRRLLGSLKPQVSRVDLPGKGVFYRLKAGPLPTRRAADSLCAQLAKAKQFCEAAFLDGSGG